MTERRTAAMASGLTAAASLALGVVMTVLASRGQDVNAGAGLLETLADDGSGWWTAARWLFLVIAGGGVGAVMAIRRFAVPARRVLADWVTVIGLIGLTVLAIDQVRLLSHTRGIARAAASRSGGVQDLVNASFLNLVDRNGILAFGAVGLWLLVASLLLLPAPTPPGLRAIGVAAGGMLLLQPVLHGGQWAAAAGAVTSGVLATGFFGWHAIDLIRGTAAPPDSVDPADLDARGGAVGVAPPEHPVAGGDVDERVVHRGGLR